MKTNKFVKPPLILSTLILCTTVLTSCQNTTVFGEGALQLSYIAGYSVENRPVECRVLGRGDNVVFILAAIHGNEVAGTALCRRLADYLLENPQALQGRKVVLMPETNPDGVALNQRYNTRGVDLNRNFAASNRENTQRYGMEGASEPETRVIAQVIEQYKPDRIITLHEPLNCVDYDGPYLELAEYLAQYCELPIKKLGTSPGSLGGYAGLDLEIPLITVEFPKDSGALDEDTLWQKYGRLMRAAVAYPEKIDTVQEL
ncbi:DUF2817 domain-containing protein [Planctomycetota bacterium]